MSSWNSGLQCGCHFYLASKKHQLPQVNLGSHTTVLRTTYETTLDQTFTNASKDPIKECFYTFPLYDGVSVASFECSIGGRKLLGAVEEKHEAKATYDKAVARGETVGLLEQLPAASDAFCTSIGNIPSGGEVVVQITYVGELKHDSEFDAIRFTIPTSVAPRYGGDSYASPQDSAKSGEGQINICVDIDVGTSSSIQGLQSPSHPIAVTMGKTSKLLDQHPVLHRASATLALGSAQLDDDFVLVISHKDNGMPTAFLETHPTIPDHRALMVDLIPKFSLPPIRPEIIFVADRSGSMASNIPTLVSALRVFLKSLPMGVKFNICSFGYQHSFLWPKSRAYDQDSLSEAMAHVQNFRADFGGTETLSALKGAIDNRFGDIDCEVLLLTDGDIWSQNQLFDYLNGTVGHHIRVFALGIGSGVSSSLIEGVARAGKGFAQMVGDGEKLDNKVVRMLKGALSPHISDYSMEVRYESAPDEESDSSWEMVERVTDSLRVLATEAETPQKSQKPISLYDESMKSHDDISMAGNQTSSGHLPEAPPPRLLQTPNDAPPLFPFTRTTIHILMSPDTLQKNPASVFLRGTSSQGPLQLEIQIQRLPSASKKIHQLAAKKAKQELEEGRGWLTSAKAEDGTLLKDRHPNCFDEMVKREAVRLGKQFQIPGKWCSFVAVSDGKASSEGREEISSYPAPSQSIFPVARSSGFSEFGSFGTAPSRRGPTSNFSASVVSQPAVMTRFGGGASTSSHFSGARFSSPGGHDMYRQERRSRSNEISMPAPTAQSSQSMTISEKVHAIIDLQKFEGAWKVSDDLFIIMGLSHYAFKSFDTAMVTMIVIVFLEEKMTSEKDVYELVVGKAWAWLQGTAITKGRMDEMEVEAREIVRKECK